MKISLPNLYLYSQPVDFRKSINGLSLILSNALAEVPQNISCLFYNNSRDRLKLLYFEPHGICLWHKRLSRHFKVPEIEEELWLIDTDKFNWLRVGLDLKVFDIDMSKKLTFF